MTAELKKWFKDFMELKQRSFKVLNPKFYVDKNLKFTLKAFE